MSPRALSFRLTAGHKTGTGPPPPYRRLAPTPQEYKIDLQACKQQTKFCHARSCPRWPRHACSTNGAVADLASPSAAETSSHTPLDLTSIDRTDIEANHKYLLTGAPKFHSQQIPSFLMLTNEQTTAAYDTTCEALILFPSGAERLSSSSVRDWKSMFSGCVSATIGLWRRLCHAQIGCGLGEKSRD